MDVPVGAPASAGPLDSVDLPQLLRLSGMTKALLTEVDGLTFDDAARTRLAEIQRRAVAAIGHGLPRDLAQELTDLSAPPIATPSDGELRLVQAQLVGWLDGLFQALQVAAVERQVQLAPPGATAAVDAPSGAIPTGDVPYVSPGSGPYL
ncbi:MAG: proteasome activator [Acidimicrobiia bacterium]